MTDKQRQAFKAWKKSRKYGEEGEFDAWTASRKLALEEAAQIAESQSKFAAYAAGSTVQDRIAAAIRQQQEEGK